MADSPDTAGPPGTAPAPPSLDEPEIEALILRFRLPPDVAQNILDQLTLALLAKRERIRNPRQWLLRALRRQCVEWWRRRRRLLARVLDTGLTDLLATSALPEEERRSLTDELRRHLSLLGPDCRRLLGRRYGLEDLEASELADDGEESALVCVEALARRLGEA